uniref:Uncharacterized protein n=1 Tax=Nelumbo nucifera TaxID=4432 RepID=A0A822YRG1_NELNU|nr:TPA_asm: hypothetical protein HUJ06_005862 [Nelumbo nucifera]
METPQNPYHRLHTQAKIAGLDQLQSQEAKRYMAASTVPSSTVAMQLLDVASYSLI